MAADLLRRAAAKLREVATAEALTPGPWDCLNGGDRIVRFKDADAWDFDYVIEEPVPNSFGQYIATVDPLVALALADLLTAIHDHLGGDGHYSAAVVAARAVLRGDGESA
jgi:hypothetical protein